MIKTLRCAAAAAALCALALAAAQPPAPSLDERVAALEAGLASLDTRFG